MADLRVIDGSHGEGGGQILRTALSLSIVARGFSLEYIRANRCNPGLRPQHLAAVRAAATVSGAAVSGDALGSTELTFAPGHAGRSGDYIFDVAATAERGSARSATLILQTLVLPLALSEGASTLRAGGGTHVDLSPPFDHFANSYLPGVATNGFLHRRPTELLGLAPGGRWRSGMSDRSGAGPARRNPPMPLTLVRRGPLRRIAGRAVAADLPERIPQRMADRARESLCALGVPVDIEAR